MKEMIFWFIVRNNVNKHKHYCTSVTLKLIKMKREVLQSLLETKNWKNKFSAFTKVLMRKFVTHFFMKIVQQKKSISNLNKIIIMLNKTLFYLMMNNKLIQKIKCRLILRNCKFNRFLSLNTVNKFILCAVNPSMGHLK